MKRMAWYIYQFFSVYELLISPDFTLETNEFKSPLTSPDIIYRPMIFGKHMAKIIESENAITLPKDIADPITTNKQKIAL